MLFQGGAQVAHLTLVQSCDTVHGGALARGWFLFRRLNCPLVEAPPTTSLTSPTWGARQAAGTTPFRTPGYPPSFSASSDEIPQTPANNPHSPKNTQHSIGTLIFRRPRHLLKDRLASPTHTLTWEEPPKPGHQPPTPSVRDTWSALDRPGQPP